MSGCEALDGYTARLLDDEGRQRFERHLAACATCQQQIARAADIDARLATWFDEQIEPRATEVGARRLVRAAETRREGAARRRAIGVFGGLAVASAVAAAVAALVVRTSGDRAPLAPVATAPSPEPAAVDVTVLWSNGGSVSPGQATETRTLEVPGEGRIVVRAAGDVIGLGPRSRAELLPTDQGHARVRLAAGLVAVQAEHRGATGSLSIEAGDYTVTVVGTRFSVSWDGAERLDVVVQEGQVMVVQPDGHLRMVRGGQRLRFGDDTDADGALAPPSEEETAQLAYTLQTTPDPVPVPVPTAPRTSPAPPSPPPVARPRPLPAPDEATIRQWLLDGDTTRAERALEARLAAAPRDSASWWLLGETRRRAGRPEGAVTAYRRVIELGTSSEANRARYQVALLLEERLGDATGAIEVYRAYLAASPRPLDAAARLRLGRLLRDRGDAAARDTLEDLVRRHPGSPEAEQATRLLGQP